MQGSKLDSVSLKGSKIEVVQYFVHIFCLGRRCQQFDTLICSAVYILFFETCYLDNSLNHSMLISLWSFKENQPDFQNDNVDQIPFSDLQMCWLV